MANIGLNVVVTSTTGGQSGFAAANAGIDSVQRKAGGLQGIVEKMVDKLQTGFAIDFMSRFNQAVVNIGRAMQQMIADGVAFNSTIETVGIGIAATLRDTDRAGNFPTFKHALTVADALVSQMKIAALECSASFEDLASTYQVAGGQMMQAGIPLKKQVDLMVLLGNAVKNAVGDSGNMKMQLITESRSLLEGQVQAGAILARRVFSEPGSKEAYAEAVLNGQAYEWLTQKLKGVAEATKVANTSFSVLKSNLGDITSQVGAKITLPLFTELKTQIAAFTAYLQGGEFTKAFAPLVFVVAEAVGEMGRALMSLLPVFANLVTKAKPFIEDLGKNFQISISFITEAVKGVSSAFGTLLEYLGKLGINFTTVMNAMLALGTVLLAFGIAKVVFGFIALAQYLTIVSWEIVTTVGFVSILKTAIVSLWAVMASNPWILALTGAALLVLYIYNKLHPAVEQTYTITEELEAKLAASKARRAKQALAAVKANPLFGATNTAEEEAKRTKQALDGQMTLLDEHNKRVQAEELLSFEERKQALSVYYAARGQIIQKQQAAELAMLGEEFKKAVDADAREKIVTKQIEAKSKYGVLVKANGDAELDANKKLITSQETLSARRADALETRLQESIKNRAIINDNVVMAEQAQNRIDIEKEASTILQEQNITRATTVDFENKLNTARIQAAGVIDQKRQAAAADYLRTTGQQIQIETAKNTLGDESVKKLEEQFSHENIILEAKKRQGEESGRIVDLAKQLVAQLAIQETKQRQMRDIERQKNAIQAGMSEIDTNVAGVRARGTPAAIQAAERKALQDKIAATQMLIEKEREIQALDKNADQSKSKETIERLNQEIITLQGNLERIGSFTDQLSAGLRGWAQSFGTIATQMATTLTNTVGQAFQGISNALANVIMGTQSLGAAMSQFALNLATSFIASVIQMILIATVAIPILTALGVLSGGATVAQGAAVTSVGLYAASSMSTAAVNGAHAFESGGFVPGGKSARDNQLIFAASGEPILSNASADYYGRPFVQGLIDRSIPRDRLYAALAGISLPSGPRPSMGAFANGGFVGTNSAINVAPTPLNLALLTREDQVDRWMERTGGVKKILKIINTHRREIGVRS